MNNFLKIIKNMSVSQPIIVYKVVSKELVDLSRELIKENRSLQKQLDEINYILYKEDTDEEDTDTDEDITNKK